MRFTNTVLFITGMFFLAACNSQMPDTSFDKDSAPSASVAAGGLNSTDFPVANYPGGMGNTGSNPDQGNPAAIGCSSLTLNSSPASDEQFLNLAYCQIFQRMPDQAGHDYWIANLSQGYPRSRALVSFLLSSEAQAKYGLMSQSASAFVASLYPLLLNRSADSGGAAYWTNRLNGINNDRIELMIEFLNTSESKAYWNM